MQPVFDLDGKVALVTGGSSGLGRAMAEALAAAGAKVVVTARRPEALEESVAAIREKGGQAAALVADLADSASLEEVARQAAEPFGPVSILINAAGGQSASAYRRGRSGLMAVDAAVAPWDSLLPLPSLGARDAEAGIRTHHQPGLTAIPARIPQQCALWCGERRDRAADTRHGGGLVERGNQCQCHCSRVLPNRAYRSGL